MSIGFSIIVCTHNPDEAIFNRLLIALQKLKEPSCSFEYLFIDNNSNPPLSKQTNLHSFLSQTKNSRYFFEKDQGLTAARLRALNECSYDYIIFFDDDNEPNEEYLVELEKTIIQYPDVFCWGPATITVEFTGTLKDRWVETKKFYFQERNWEETNYGIAAEWQYYFPYGTGLVVQKEIMKEYERRIKSGQYSLTDRKGRSLSSGGDLQIVLTATAMSKAVGSIKGLKVNHLINYKKATVNYLERQVYGTASSYVAAHKQVKSSLEISEHLAGNSEILKHLIPLIRKWVFKISFKEFRLELADLMGATNARYIYKNSKNKPFLIKLYEKLINA